MHALILQNKLIFAMIEQMPWSQINCLFYLFQFIQIIIVTSSHRTDSIIVIDSGGLCEDTTGIIPMVFHWGFLPGIPFHRHSCFFFMLRVISTAICILSFKPQLKLPVSHNGAWIKLKQPLNCKSCKMSLDHSSANLHQYIIIS